jgi:hypothetical protein
MDEGYIGDRYPVSPTGHRLDMVLHEFDDPATPKLDPPDDGQPSLMKGSMEEAQYYNNNQVPYEDVPDPDDPIIPATPDGEPSVGVSAFFNEEEEEEEAAAFFDDDEEVAAPAEESGKYFESPVKQAEFEGEPEYGKGFHQPVSPDDEERYGHNDHYVEDEEPFTSPQNGFEQPPDEFEQFPSPGRNQQQQAPHEFERFPSPGRTQQPNDFETLSPPHGVGTPQGHYPMSPPDDDDRLYGGEEKKYSMDEHANPEIEFQMSQDSDRKSGEEDFTPIKREGYKLSDSSPRSMASDGSHQSAALRGAQEILKKNRRRRSGET